MTALQRLVQAAERIRDNCQPVDVGWSNYENLHRAIVSAKTELAALQAKQEKMCPQCGGEGCVRVEGFDVVTRDMAIDGGDERLEGQHIRHDHDEQCQNCGGTGYMVEPDYLQAAGVTRPEKLKELFEAVDKLLYTTKSSAADDIHDVLQIAHKCRKVE